MGTKNTQMVEERTMNLIIDEYTLFYVKNKY